MIRNVEMRDAAAIARLAGVLGYPVTESVVSTNLVRILKNKNHSFLVFEAEVGVVGFIEAEVYEAVYSEEVMFNVLGLVVDTAQQGHGVGSQLLAALEKKAAHQGIFCIRLNSGEQRHAAHKFYEKNGYTSNHTQKRFLKKL